MEFYGPVYNRLVQVEPVKSVGSNLKVEGSGGASIWSEGAVAPSDGPKSPVGALFRYFTLAPLLVFGYTKDFKNGTYCHCAWCSA